MKQSHLFYKNDSNKDFFESFLAKGRIVLVVDQQLFRRQRAYLLENYIPEKALLFVFKATEKAKNRKIKEQIEDFLITNHCGKDTNLIAIGGGITTDIVGFVAATYMRGIDWIAIPSTLLGMVDACIGGKVGVNTSLGKNLIGAFHPPKYILIDYRFLESLPLKQRLYGLAEIIKSSLVADPILFKNLEEGFQEARDIPLCIATKQKIVEEDPFDEGKRKILNFGHTIAHAIEAASHYKIAHGLAVAHGILVESYLSMLLGLIPKSIYSKIDNLLKKYRYPLRKINPQDLVPYLLIDKKNKNRGIHFSLIASIGKAAEFDGSYTQEIPLNMIIKALEAL